MSTFVLLNATTFVGELDLTTALNQMNFDLGVEQKDSTTFGTNGWRSFLPGLKTTDIKHTGFVDFPDPDATTFANIGTANRVVTVTPNQAGTVGGTSGDVAYMTQALRTDYQVLGAVGEIAPFSGSLKGSSANGVIRGKLLLPKTTTSATLNGTGQTLGAVGASQFVYAAIHVFSAGTSATVKVQSDDNSSYTSPTDRITFTLNTSVGATWATPLAGAITDDHWRVIVSAISGSFTIACSVGIQ